MAELRRAATLNHFFPTLCTRLWVDGLVVLEVGMRAEPAGDEIMTVRPCPFRMRVAQAWQYCRDGGQLSLLNLPDDPDVEIVTVIGGATWLSGIVRVPSAASYSYLLTTTLDPHACRAEASAWFDRIGALENVEGIGIRGDPDTNVSVIHFNVAPVAGLPDEPVLIDMLEHLAATLTIAELVNDLTLSESA